MKVITLKELRWFSFTSSSENQKSLTLWQAVAFILIQIEGFKEEALKFMDGIYNLEKEFTEILIDNYESPDSLQSLQDKDIDADDFYLEDLKLQIGEAFHDLELLDENRGRYVDSLGMPFLMIYELLISEIVKFKSNEQTSLKIIERKYEEEKLYLFGKTKLSQWKSITLLNQLGLSNETLSRSRKQRDDKLENQKIITGMLIHILAHQPILDKRGKPIRFIKGDNPSNINYSLIFNYFVKNHLGEDHTSFPKQSTVTNFLSESYRNFKNIVSTR